jgi:hypothetical protein
LRRRGEDYSEVGKIILGHAAQATSHATVSLLICYMIQNLKPIKNNTIMTCMSEEMMAKDQWLSMTQPLVRALKWLAAMCGETT